MKKRYLKCPDCGKQMAIDKAKTGSRAKEVGGYYERRVAKKITKLTGYKFHKNPEHLGIIAGRDVVCLETPDIYSMPFSIECKNLERLTLLNVFKNPRMLRNINWKDPENDVLIFNDKGIDVVVANFQWIAGKQSVNWFGVFSFGENLGEESGGNLYVMLSLKEFCKKIIGEKNERDLS